MKINAARIATIVISIGAIIWFAMPMTLNVKNIGNILAILFFSIILLFALFYKILARHRKLLLTCQVTLAICLCWGIFATGCMAFGARSVPPTQATVVVLGCQVKGDVPSLSLQRRIEAAYSYLEKNPQSTCIASGGQGGGENISEAEAIRNALVEMGIAPERILLEDKSVSTEENIKFSLEIINKNNLNKDLAIVTDGYHQFRARLLAKRMDIEAYAVRAKTPWYIFSAYYARELLAITKEIIIPSN